MPPSDWRVKFDRVRMWIPVGVLRALLVAGCFAIITGWIWRDGKAYNAGLAATVGTALGTAILALATYYLATTTVALSQTTGEEVRASQRLAEMAAEDQAYRERPELRVTYIGVEEGDHVLRVQNLGNGPARNVRIYSAGGFRAGRPPIETMDFVPIDADQRVRVSPGKLSAEALQFALTEFDRQSWDLGYENRWRTWLYESLGGQPTDAKRVEFFRLGITPLGKGVVGG
jgi:hypothetical protein